MLSILTGLVLGGVTLLGQASLPAALVQLANSGAVWVVVAFGLGWSAPRRLLAMLGGTLTLLSALVGYYGAAAIVLDLATTLQAMLLWILTAVVGGPVMGAAGYGARHARGYRQYISKAALGAVFLGEGVYYWSIQLAGGTVALWVAIAGVLTLAWLWRGPGRLQIGLLTLGGGLAVFGAYRLLVILDRIRAGIPVW